MAQVETLSDHLSSLTTSAVENGEASAALPAFCLVQDKGPFSLSSKSLYTICCLRPRLYLPSYLEATWLLPLSNCREILTTFAGEAVAAVPEKSSAEPTSPYLLRNILCLKLHALLQLLCHRQPKTATPHASATTRTPTTTTTASELPDPNENVEAKTSSFLPTLEASTETVSPAIQEGSSLKTPALSPDGLIRPPTFSTPVKKDENLLPRAILTLLISWLNGDDAHLPLVPSLTRFLHTNADASRNDTISAFSDDFLALEEQVTDSLFPGLCPAHLPPTSSDFATLNPLENSSINPYGDTICQQILCKRPAVLVAHFCMVSELASNGRSFSECTLALFLEALRLPLSFLEEMEGLLDSGLRFQKRMKLLLEESKLPRSLEGSTALQFSRLPRLASLYGGMEEAILEALKLRDHMLKNWCNVSAIKETSPAITIVGFHLIKTLQGIFELTNDIMKAILPEYEHLLSQSDFLEKLLTFEPLTFTALKDTNFRFFSTENFKEINVLMTSLRYEDFLPAFTTNSSLNVLQCVYRCLEKFFKLLSGQLCVTLHFLRYEELEYFKKNFEKKRQKSKYPLSPRMDTFQEILWQQLVYVHTSKLAQRVLPSSLFAYSLLFLENGEFMKLKETLETLFLASNQETRRPKVPKGTQDFTPQRMIIREFVINEIIDVFKKHGGVQIDTPIFELKETLTGKYGEDQKLIYDLKDQGGEQLSLRYDLTVPFARYVATQNIEKIKRFHIGKVYRRDEPHMQKGRFREFYQCDFDIAGKYDVMLPDAEILIILVEILKRFQRFLGNFVIKLNHRTLLDAILRLCGVSEKDLRPVCSAIDKLDKEAWITVKQEMMTLKGIPEAVADRIGTFVCLNGTPLQLLEKLRSISELMENSTAQETLQTLETLFTYLDTFHLLPYISLDMALARGLDYYTGIIYEAVIKHFSTSFSHSIAAGGRYDTLNGMFSGKAIPAVGVSFGVERMFSMIEKFVGISVEASTDDSPPSKTSAAASASSKKLEVSYALPEATTDVLVCTVGNELITQRLTLCKLLWENGIACEFLYMKNPKLKKQMDYASEKHIPLLLILGEEEVQKGTVQLRVLTHGKPPLSITETSSLLHKEEVREAKPLHKEILLTNVVEEIQTYFTTHAKMAEKLKNLFSTFKN